MQARSAGFDVALEICRFELHGHTVVDREMLPSGVVRLRDVEQGMDASTVQRVAAPKTR